MGLFSKKVKQLQGTEEFENVGKIASDKAVDIIKQLGGSNAENSKYLIDNYVVFTNAAGGTGASTIASNVAYMMKAKGFNVIMIDLNIMCPIQHTCLNIKQELEKPDLVSYLLGKNNLGDSIVNTGSYSVLYANNRSISDLINCNSDIAITNFNDMINKLRSLYSIIIVDCPMQVDNMLCNNVMYNCDSIYMVWDEGLPSISNTDRLRRNMAFTGIDSYTKLRIVLNKRTNTHYNMYPFQKLNLELLEVLPFDTDIIENSLRAQVFCEKGSTSSKNAAEFARRIDSLTDKVLRISGLVE